MKIDREAFYEKLAETRLAYPHNQPKPEGASAEKLLAEHFGYAYDDTMHHKLMAEKYTHSHMHPKLAPHAKSLLKWLKKNQYHVALISNAHSEGPEYNLKQFGIREYFDEIIVSDAVRGLKSELIPFKVFFERHPEVKPEECLMIGDSLHEDTACQKMGIPAAVFEINLFHYSPQRVNEMRAEGRFPNYRINSLQDVKEIVKKIEGKKHD